MPSHENEGKERARTCKLGRRRPEEETTWTERCRQLWAPRPDELVTIVEELNGRRRSMDASKESAMKNRTTAERKSERELVVTRTLNAPARIVFEAWTKPELMKRWWAPKSCGLVLSSCEMDVRIGGSYRFVFVFDNDASKQMAFFGKYLEVTSHSRLVWTNEESDDGGAVTTVTFEEKGGKTLLVMHDLYPSKEALDGAIASGSTSGVGETFEQLDDLLVTLSQPS
jgi:uncharacterized protein YndB with AHSA1/START domain